MKTRDKGVDLLRAAAITMVVAHHIPQHVDHPSQWLTAITKYGACGVDVFFVLSGWLIGGLLWQEYYQYGNVQVSRFIGRRALRTIPPYFTALTIVFISVNLSRHESFDWSYLVFFQNYYPDIPYFHVSWSLCVEEHFYMAMPFIALLAMRWSKFPEVWILLGTVVPAACRFMAWVPDCQKSFGYYVTATHLNYEGLLLGVWASMIYWKRPPLWKWLKQMAPYGCAISLIAMAIVETLNQQLRYSLFHLAACLTAFFILIWSVERRLSPLPSSRFVYWTAAISYSVYLTHLSAIFAAKKISNSLALNTYGLVFMDTIWIVIFGLVFYLLIEVPSLALRHKLISRRNHEPSPLRESFS